MSVLPSPSSRSSTENPHRSPLAEPQSQTPIISDEIVSLLIDGNETETLAFYDVSDTQIYGRKNRRDLRRSLSDAAEAEGCFPTAYQTIHWLCFVHFPVWSLATYVVMPCKECDDPDGDADQYRAIRVQTDISQITLHSSVAYSILIGIFLLIWWWLLYSG